MKNQIAIFWRMLVITAPFIILASCGDDKGNGKTVEEKQLEKLVGTWNLQSANDGTNRTDFVDVVMTLNGTYSKNGTYNFSFSATEWPDLSPWPDNGSWKFDPEDVENTIIRLEDTQEINYALSNNDDQLVFSFNYTGPGFFNGRTESVTGNWEFVFTRAE